MLADTITFSNLFHLLSLIRITVKINFLNFINSNEDCIPFIVFTFSIHLLTNNYTYNVNEELYHIVKRILDNVYVSSKIISVCLSDCVLNVFCV